MKFTTTALLLSSLASYVFAQQQTAGVSITNPVLNTTAYAGQHFTITWTQSDTTVTNINSIALMDGDAAALTTVIENIIPSTIAANALTYDWAVPSNLTERKDYALAFKGDNGFISYSAYFSILKAPTTAAAATTTASASASKPVISSVNGQRCIVG